MLDINSTRTLNNKTKMPLLGLGVYQIKEGDTTIQATSWALEAGYRHIDTAKFYHNEASVGEAVRASKLKRSDIWVTTKLWPTDFGHPEKALETSLNELGFDYVDLYLIHFPVPALEKRIWKVMEKLYDQKLARAIGVSNFSVGRIKKVMHGANVVPAVNQIKQSPFNYDLEMHDFCAANDIAVEAYSPLTQGKMLDAPLLEVIAKKYSKSTAQVLIRWCLQKDMIVIPRSKNHGRIKENADVYDFKLADEDMKSLDELSSS